MLSSSSRVGFYAPTAGLLGAIVLLALMWVSCSTGSGELKGFSIFADFTFVGSAPYQPGAAGAGGGKEQLPKHGTAQVSLPDRPQPGVQYIFHHRRPVDNEKLALVDLPGRVKSAGITIVWAPNSSKDLMYPYVGGPLFKIQIEDDSHKGAIYNQIDPDLMHGSNRDWAEEDYVLLWFK